jgi:uncharacterized protein (TIGR02145 family)
MRKINVKSKNMRKLNGILLLSLVTLGAVLMLTSNCKKDKNEDNNQVASLTTSAIKRITDTSAVGGGVISSDGGASVTERGVCWSSSHSPTISDHKMIHPKDTLCFSCCMTGLEANTQYYARAYATNSEGTSYGNEEPFQTPPRMTDIDGNVYHTVRIGDQVWMAENLRVTRYRNGDEIPEVINYIEWCSLTTGALWGPTEAYVAIYGPIYNGYAMADPRQIAPSGWHLPSDAEWKILEGTVDSQFHLGDPEWDKSDMRGSDAGGKLKSTTNNWVSPNIGATDEYGFTALPGGYRHWDSGQLNDINGGAYFGTSSVEGDHMWTHSLSQDDSRIRRTFDIMRAGGSVRLIQD